MLKLFEGEREKLGEAEFLGLAAAGRLTGLRPPEGELRLLVWTRFPSGIPDLPNGPWVGKWGGRHGNFTQV